MYLLFPLSRGQQKNNTQPCRAYQDNFFKTKSIHSKHMVSEHELSYFFLNCEFAISILQINQNYLSWSSLYVLVTTSSFVGHKHKVKIAFPFTKETSRSKEITRLENDTHMLLNVMLFKTTLLGFKCIMNWIGI